MVVVVVAVVVVVVVVVARPAGRAAAGAESPRPCTAASGVRGVAGLETATRRPAGADEEFTLGTQMRPFIVKAARGSGFASCVNDPDGVRNADNLDALMLNDREQRLIPGDDQFGLGGNCGADDHIVIRIGGDARHR